MNKTLNGDVVWMDSIKWQLAGLRGRGGGEIRMWRRKGKNESWLLAVDSPLFFFVFLKNTSRRSGGNCLIT